MSVVVGATFLVLYDVIDLVFLFGIELPVMMLTGLIVAPLLIVLVVYKKRDY